ncbi:hypothetical protein [Arthrobacter sp. R4-81]
MGEKQLMDQRLAEIAQELYGLPLEEFVAARTAAAKSADREMATIIRGLPKPSAAAWAVNMFARHDPDSVRQLSELGQSMRAAQDSLDAVAMRELGQERRRLLSEVMDTVRTAAEQRGRKISDAVATEVEETLRAATADSGAAAAVRSGQLLKVLSSDGVDQVDLDGAVAVPQVLTDALQSETRNEGKGQRRPEPATTIIAGQRSAKRGGQDRARDSAERNVKRADGRADKPRLQAVQPTRRPALPSALEKALASLAEAEAVTRSAGEDAAAAENRLEEVEAELGRLAERSRKLREELKNLDRELDRVRKERETAAIETQQASRAADKGRRTEELARQRVLRLRNTQN